MYRGEKFNSISHLVGAALAAIGAVTLIVMASLTGDPWKIVSFSIYGAMLLSLYLTSTLYHSLRGRAKRIWCKFDHCAIYLLIAGSYTPFALVSLRGTWGWTLFGAIWSLAILGIVQEIWLAKGLRIVSLILYVLMGWMAVVAIGPLINALTWDGFIWLAAGGLFYTVGIIFYATDEKWRYGHGVWHLFVLGGSACHYFAVFNYVA
ncbi:hemolysin III family protein [Pusillimonas sp. ANT_WB101]|uniref:PAQR family membrane homeostasis protein TrhA n=1 Tax=Pusillimonas sp. ANT_WB101 TaxID=2597356 RepID=UPI0011EFA53B|nr:hemolysin III family protein [Pusillimonas sp. ANT_WB101]KAA0911557.1 hemolysin III family protein [Pusillimonas sp. ANT_WB101]